MEIPTARLKSWILMALIFGASACAAAVAGTATPSKVAMHQGSVDGGTVLKDPLDQNLPAPVKPEADPVKPEANPVKPEADPGLRNLTPAR